MPIFPEYRVGTRYAFRRALNSGRRARSFYPELANRPLGQLNPAVATTIFACILLMQRL
ncbi:hypothetical protein [Sodalis-like endosymbiont of Proechinophthirus fluctus]|uniref:hypothetical protein n=1 Tax=Sodalis-like endosymbiont of Proechinophthirus fluctus TaxID=1462730 RepID=UPI000A788ADF